MTRDCASSGTIRPLVLKAANPFDDERGDRKQRDDHHAATNAQPWFLAPRRIAGFWVFAAASFFPSPRSVTWQKYVKMDFDPVLKLNIPKSR